MQLERVIAINFQENTPPPFPQRKNVLKRKCQMSEADTFPHGFLSPLEKERRSFVG
jgi:hypothetical protein